MTKEQIQLLNELTTAALNGKVIQEFDQFGNWVDIDLEKMTIDTDRISFYRVRPYDIAYVPYANAEEFLTAQRLHGPYLKVKSRYILPFEIKSDGVYASGDPDDVSFKELCEIDDITWQDGTKCAVLRQISNEDI